MDSVALVESQIEGGGRLVAELVRQGFDLTAACWAKPTAKDRWYLYLASPVIDETGPDYRVVLEVLRRLPDCGVSPFDVKVVGAASPLAREVLKLRRRFPDLTRYSGPYLGDVSIDGAYLYPPPSARETAAGKGNGSADGAGVQAPQTVTVVSDIRQEGDTLVVRRRTIPLPAGVAVGESKTQTIPLPPGVNKVRYEDE